MRWLWPVVLVVSACRFTLPALPADGDPGTTDAAPPVDTSVRFTSVTVSQASIRPGLYGIEVTTVLHNDRATPITGIRASLTLLEGTTDRAADFRWRDADARDGVMAAQPATLGPGEDATFRFRLDVLPGAATTGPILVNGSAQFQADDGTRSASPLDPPTGLEFETLPEPIVVSTEADEDNANTQVSFREAIQKALANPGFDRIVFDPAVFPPGSPRTITLDDALDQLPAFTGDVTVIDGGASSITLGVEASWGMPTGRTGLRIAGGTLVVHDLGFRDFAFGYQQEDLSMNNCGSGIPRQGGTILVTDGTLILDGNTFSDPGVTERNCFATAVRLAGGSGHRILNNRWTQLSMDALNISASTIEVTDNVMDAGTVLADRNKTDDCILVETEDDSDLSIVGNVCIDRELSAVAASGGGTGVIHVVNNTFVRNGRIDKSAVRRENGHRRVELHNNVYQDNSPSALQTDDGNGVDLTISHESTFPAAFCSTCTNAVIDSPTVSAGFDLQLTSATGTTRADFTPRAGSPLVDSGRDLVDRNGSAPGRFNGASPDRGAVELP